MSDHMEPNTTALMILGILTTILGIVAIATPAVAGTAVVIVICILLVIAGVVQFISGLRTEGWSHKLPPLILGVITSLAGLVCSGTLFSG